MPQDIYDAELDGGAAKDVEADPLVVALHRPDSEQPMGLRLDVSEPTGSIFIARVAADPGTVVGSSNEKAPKHQLIRKGNYIIAVDGNTSLLLMSQLLDLPAFSLTIRQGQTFVATLPKQSRPMGLEIRFGPTGTSLCINGDRIVAVSAVEGGPSVLLSQLQSSESPQLLISRCPTSCAI